MVDNTWFGLVGMPAASASASPETEDLLRRLQMLEGLGQQDQASVQTATPFGGIAVAQGRPPAASEHPKTMASPVDGRYVDGPPPTGGAGRMGATAATEPASPVAGAMRGPQPPQTSSTPPMRRAGAFPAPPAAPPPNVIQAQASGDAGFSPSFGERLQHFGNALTGRSNASLEDQTRQRNATYHALIKMGLDDQTARAATLNPEMLKTILGVKLGKGRLQGKASLTPSWSQDDEGNWVMIQTNELGEAMRTKIPSGLTPVPPGDIAEQKRYGTEKGKLRAKAPAEQRQARQKMRTLNSQFGILSANLDQALEMVGSQGAVPETGPIGGLRSAVTPWTDAGTLKQLLDTIRANIGFDKLQAMRDASPTGGALGQVSEFENKLLQATSGALEQWGDDQQLKQNLERIKQAWTDLNQAYAEEYRMQYGEDPPGVVSEGGATSNSPPPPGAKRGKDGNYYIPDPDRPGKYLRWR